MADSDFVRNNRFVERYLPVTNRDENGRTLAVQAVEERVNTDETVEGFKTWFHFGLKADKELTSEFRDH